MEITYDKNKSDLELLTNRFYVYLGILPSKMIDFVSQYLYCKFGCNQV